ncbi:MAG: SIS domain-containing protein [Clostridia bacterium]|nr:SIS domain-containing protein [Clostridia bacterium]MBQ3553207.1 SIS domain-containing protein [Clostridia bacterium]
MITDQYFEKMVQILDEIRLTQAEKIKKTAELVAKTIKQDGIIYIFGCGHSHLIALDCFYRAGGLANVSAMLDTDLMLHNGAAKSSKMEKMQGIAEEILKRYCITEKDFLFIVSTSGKNAVPVEMARLAQGNNIPHASILSSAYFSDKKEEPLLYECSDIYIDNCVPHGDAVMEIAGLSVKMGSVSTAASSFIMQSVLMEAAELAADAGTEPPVYMSGNVSGGADYNKALIDMYLPRIKHL